MDMEAYKSEIRLKLTGCILDLELDDATLESIVNSAFREIQRYIDTTRLVTIPFENCIDLTDCKVSSVSRIFRAVGYLMGTDQGDGTSRQDPMYASQWQMLAGMGSGVNYQDWVYNYSSWNTMLQLKNTTSTDLAFRFDKHSNHLYINVGYDRPEKITVEYVPRYDDVSEIVTDYWIDLLVRLSTALAKNILGRIRSRYNQSNALWSQDGEILLSESAAELEEIRTHLKDNSQLVYPID